VGIAASIRSWQRRIGDSIKFEGCRRFAVRAATRPFYRAALFSTVPLDTFLSDGERASLEVRSVTQEDIPALLRLRFEYTSRLIRSRLRDGEEGFLAMDDQNPVYVAWVRRGEARFAELGLVLPLLPDEVFAYDAFVRRDYRGREVLHEVRPRVDGRLRGEGFRSRVAFTTPGRRPWGGIATRRTAPPPFAPCASAHSRSSG